MNKVFTNKKIKIDKLIIKAEPPTKSLIKKELITFFKTPVFIVNAGFALVLFILAVIIISIKFDSVIPVLTNKETGLGISYNIVKNNISILIFGLISMASYMTSITNSVISLEGRNINILKALPIKTKTILLSKIYSSLVLTTPVLIIGDLILIIRFKIQIIEAVLLLFLSILIPLVSHFIGLIINLKYPKLDAENSTEVVKQSTSSFISVMIGMLLFMISIIALFKLLGEVSPIKILLGAALIYILIDTLLYLYLIKISIKDFNHLSV